MEVRLTLDGAKIEQLVRDIRHDLAELLRERADDEISRYVIDRMRFVADEFDSVPDTEQQP